jgi:hypothetical protein
MRTSRLALAAQVLLFNASVSASECISGTALPMSAERTGHASVQLVLAGRPVRMLVDTGANVSTLDTAAAKSLDIAVAAESGAPPGFGRASAAVEIEGKSFGPQSFSVMDLSFINIPSHKYGSEPFAGQLGAAFFIEFKASIDFGNMRICLLAKP